MLLAAYPHGDLMPDVDPERSRKTREGLARARARGVKLGGARDYDRAQLSPAVRARLIELYQSGLGYGRLADALNAEQVPTRTGRGQWHATTVRREIQQVESEEIRS